MDVRLLRLAQRDRRGNRRWVVPGHDNAIAYTARGGLWNVPQLSWPHREADGSEVRRSVRLDWHGAIARRAVRTLLSPGAL